MNDPQISLNKRSVRLLASVQLPQTAFTPHQFKTISLGREVKVTGKWQCYPPARNPAKLSDGFFLLSLPRFKLVSSPLNIHVFEDRRHLFFELGYKFRSWLYSLFIGHPHLQGLVIAIWTGDSSLLDAGFKKLYLEGGMLQVLALSGQHVVVLVLMVEFFLKVLMRALMPLGGAIWKFYPLIRSCIPALCAGILWITGMDAPSVRRTVVMTVCLLALRMRLFECSLIQLTTSCVALMVLCAPEILTSTSFLLSATACSLLSQVAAKERGRLKAYITVSVLMPLFCLPINAFLFAKISVFAPLMNTLFSWIWDFILIPFGFVIPFVVAAIPELSAPILGFVETLWTDFVDLHLLLSAQIHAGYWTCIRPTWVELIIIQAGWLVFLKILAVWMKEVTRLKIIRLIQCTN